MAELTEDDLTDEVLAKAHTDQIRETYGVACKRFYEIRRLRGVKPKVKPGPKPAAPASGQKALKEKARKLHRAVLAQSTPRAGQSTSDLKRRKLYTLFQVPADEADQLMVKLMISWAFLREFARVGVDPCQKVVQWSGLFPVSEFLRIVSMVNSFCVKRPSFHSAVFGSATAQAMHSHNWFHTDDYWCIQLMELVVMWAAWDVPASTQVQLISLLVTFNGRVVLAAVKACDSPSALPIHFGDSMRQFSERLEAFLIPLLHSQQNLFLMRFNATAFNALLPDKCKSEAALSTARTTMKRVLNQYEADGLLPSWAKICSTCWMPQADGMPTWSAT